MGSGQCSAFICRYLFIEIIASHKGSMCDLNQLIYLQSSSSLRNIVTLSGIHFVYAGSLYHESQGLYQGNTRDYFHLKTSGLITSPQIYFIFHKCKHCKYILEIQK